MATDTPAQIEEERRILYVAMTSREADLHLILPQRFFTHQQPSSGDRHGFASRTRLVPAAILDRLYETEPRSPAPAGLFSWCEDRRTTLSGRGRRLLSGSPSKDRCATHRERRHHQTE